MAAGPPPCPSPARSGVTGSAIPAPLRLRTTSAARRPFTRRPSARNTTRECRGRARSDLRPRSGPTAGVGARQPCQPSESCRHASNVPGHGWPATVTVTGSRRWSMQHTVRASQSHRTRRIPVTTGETRPGFSADPTRTAGVIGWHPRVGPGASLGSPGSSGTVRPSARGSKARHHGGSSWPGSVRRSRHSPPIDVRAPGRRRACERPTPRRRYAVLGGAGETRNLGMCAVAQPPMGPTWSHGCQSGEVGWSTARAEDLSRWPPSDTAPGGPRLNWTLDGLPRPRPGPAPPASPLPRQCGLSARQPSPGDDSGPRTPDRTHSRSRR